MSPPPPSDDTPLIWLPPTNKAQGTAWFCRVVIFGCLAVLALDTTHGVFFVDSPVALWLLLLLSCIVLYGSQSPRWPLSYVIGGWDSTAPRVYYRATLVQPGYERMLEALEKTLQEGRETGLQFAAHVDGELVIDIVGGIYCQDDHRPPMTSDAYSCVWSSSKVVTSVLMAWLVDQGYLDYATKICHYWPEFVGGGKEELTVAHVLHHNAGLQTEPQGANALTLEDVLLENINRDNVARKLETMTCRFSPYRSKHFTYHAMTRGWFLNEIARRVDPQQRTLGAILREEFAKPLNIQEECYLGLPSELCDPSSNPKLRTVDPLPPFVWVLCNWLCQWIFLVTSLCGGLALPMMDLHWGYPIFYTALIVYMTLHWQSSKAFDNPQRAGAHDLTQRPEYLQGETPSANIQASARALAAISNALITTTTTKARQKKSKTRPIFSNPQETLYQMAQNETTKYIKPFHKVTYNDGGLAVLSGPDRTDIPLLPGVPYAWGWFGFNGSVNAFHPRGDFAIAFQPTTFNELQPRERIRHLTRTFMECAQAIHGPKFGSKIDMSRGVV